MKKTDGLNIDRIAFLGRTYAEYLDMFGLSESMLGKGRVLDCPAGASSFAAEAHCLGYDVTASDILYDLPVECLLEKGKKDMAHVFQKFDDVSHLYVWNYYVNKNAVMALRDKALETFASDFNIGYEEGRYIPAGLPRLPFPDNVFSLVLSGHFLFLYGDRLNLDFHKTCLMELLRVCSGEVRVFPLVGLDTKPYRYFSDIVSFLDNKGVEADVINVPLEFQKGANLMMKLRRIS